ncbi:MAG: DUF2815 family protein [Holosporales bacterium]|jgi:hypothetical protein|nr:DUF2815 family protein [Holosporales bacterium]
MSSYEDQKTTRITTGVVRLSFANIWEPRSIDGAEPKYSASLLISKDDGQTIEKVNNAIGVAIEKGKQKFGWTGQERLRTPFHDGDSERAYDAAYANHFYVNANNRMKPLIVDSKCEEITDEERVYSGAYVRAIITMFPYSKSGNKGVACSLGNIQKVKDGEPLGSPNNATNDFADSEEFFSTLLEPNTATKESFLD